MLDFRVETFFSVCRQGSFTRAAEELHITQPAVSQHIRYLEERYGAELFLRDGRRVQLTQAGRIFLSTMRSVRNDEAVMARRMEEQQGGRRSLRLGVTMTIGEYVIADPAARYLRRHPGLDLHLRCGNTSDLLADLRAGRIECALAEGYYPPEEYDQLLYRREPYIPVCAAGHAFARPVRETRDLLGERLLVREAGSGTREILERDLAVKNLRIEDFAHLVEAENMHTIVDLAARDCGVTFLYRAAAQRELERGTLVQIPLEDFHIVHDFTFLWSRGSAFSRYYASVCRALGE